MNDENPYAAPRESGRAPSEVIAEAEARSARRVSMLQAFRVFFGGLLGAMLAPALFSLAVELLARKFRWRGDFTNLIGSCNAALFIGGAICGGVFFSQFGIRPLPRWIAAASLGALCGAISLFFVANIHASRFEFDAEDVRLAWLKYGGLPFLVVGAFIAISIDRRFTKARR